VEFAFSEKGDFMYSAENITNYILCYYNKRNIWISNLKLQKIFYFLQAQFMVYRNRPLIDEEIEAVDWGTVVWSVYHKYKIFGGASIPVISTAKFPHYVADADKKLIDAVLDKVAYWSPTYMLQIIHNQHPWKMAYYNRSNISNHELRRYFAE
jgi:uncharacterized phage-associated protein